MKKYFLNKTGESSNTYSVYENPDKKLKEEIASFDIDRSKVTLGWTEKEWEILEWEKDEVKCKHGRDISYFKRQEIEEALTENLEDARNKKYLAYYYFKKAFGIISRLNEYKNTDYESITLRKIDLDEPIPFGMDEKRIFPINTRSVEFYKTFYDYEFESSNAKIQLSGRKTGNSLCLYFNKEGNYINRDYNEDLNRFECKDISPVFLYEKFEKYIIELGSLQHCKGKYYTDKFCYIPFYYNDRGKHELGVQIIPIREDGKSYQIYAGQTIYKKPSKTEEKSGLDLLNDIKKLITPEFENIFNLKQELIET